MTSNHLLLFNFLIFTIAFVGALPNRLPKLPVGLLMGCIYTLIIGLRPIDRGVDTPTYILMFSTYQSCSALFADIYYSKEFLFHIIGVLIKSNGGSPSTFLFTITALSIFSLTLAVRSICRKAEISELFTIVLFLIFCTSSFYLQIYNVIRQCLAICICLYAISLYLDEKKILAITIMFAALFIHNSVIFILVPTIFSGIHINFNRTIIIIAIAFGLYFLMPIVFATLNIPILSDKFAAYINVPESTADNLYVKIVLLIIETLFFTFVFDKSTNQAIRFLITLYVATLFFTISLLISAQTSARIIYLTGFIAPILFISFVKHTIMNEQKRVFVGIFLSFALLYHIFVATHPSIAVALGLY